MASFTVRVELVDIAHENSVYEKLHKVLREANFRHTFEGNGKGYQLPRAEYIVDANATAAEIGEIAQSIAEALHKPGARIIVTRETDDKDGFWWSPNLLPLPSTK
jgi:hypothetical protein